MSNPIEAIHKLLDSIEYQYDLGSWHRIAVIAGFGLLIYAIAVSFMYFDSRGSKGN